MLTKDQLTKRIAGLSKKSVTLRQEIHLIAVAVIGHVYEHGDTRVADSLVAAMGKGFDRKAILLYFKEYGAMRWDKAESCFVINKAARETFEFDEAYLNDETTPRWYDFAPSKKNLSDEPYDFLDVLQNALKKADKVRKEGKPIGHEEAIREVAALISRIRLTEFEAGLREDAAA